MTPRYSDRAAAGGALAERLSTYRDQADVTVLGLARGGVPVAAVVADRLGSRLDVLVVRKLGVPWAREVAFGALGPGGVLVRNDEIADRLDPADLSAVVRKEELELARRERIYRAGRLPLDLAGQTTIVVDDGLATGATARAAVAVARKLGAPRVVVAVPVGSPEAVRAVAEVADQLICPTAPATFGAVSRFYRAFEQVTDAQVVALLAGLA